MKISFMLDHNMELKKINSKNYEHEKNYSIYFNYFNLFFFKFIKRTILYP